MATVEIFKLVFSRLKRKLFSEGENDVFVHMVTACLTVLFYSTAGCLGQLLPMQCCWSRDRHARSYSAGGDSLVLGRQGPAGRNPCGAGIAAWGATFQSVPSPWARCPPSTSLCLAPHSAEVP